MANPQEANKKGLKKEQANNAKAMSACAEAIKALVKPKEFKPRIPKNSSHKFKSLTSLTPRLGKVFVPTSKGLSSASQSPRLKPDPDCSCGCIYSSDSSSGSGSERCPVPFEGSRREASV